MIAKAISTAAPSTSPVLPPSRRTARPTKISTAVIDSTPPTRPSHQRPLSAAATTSSALRRQPDAPRRNGGHRSQDRHPETVHPRSRNPSPTSNGEHGPRATHDQTGGDRSAQPVHDSTEGHRLRTTTTIKATAPIDDVPTFHDRQDTFGTPGSSEAVEGVGQSVQVNCASGDGQSRHHDESDQEAR